MKIALTFIVVLLSLAVAAKHYDHNKSDEDLFDEYLRDHPSLLNDLTNRDPKQISPARNRTLGIFKDNMKKIRKLNILGGGQVAYDLGSFAHMSADEFAAFIARSGLAMNPSLEINGTQPEPHKRSVETIPAAFSWKAKGKVTSVKNQGSCGSCWSFATNGAIEASMIIAGKGSYDLSDQAFVDCERTYSHGCNGGYPYYALKYAMNYGVPIETAYPYKAVQSTSCAIPSTAARKKITNFATVSTKTSAYYQAQVATYAPLIVFVDCTAWQFYSSGIMPASRCGTSTSTNHVVLLTGYGASSTGSNYWEIKNSWGTGWGEAGYIRIARSSANVCGIYTYSPYLVIA